MNSATCRKPPNDGQKFWSCPLYYSSPKEKCASFCWDRDLATSGLKMQQRSATGEIISEVQFVCDIASEETFSITLIPPDATAIEFLKSEGATPDEKTANINGYAQLYPPGWILPLERHDAVMKSLEASRAKDHPLWKAVPIPQSARTMLLNDLQHQRLQSYAVQHANTAASRALSSQLGNSPVTGGGSAAAAASSSHAADVDLEDAPVQPAAGRKKKGGLLLAPKSRAAAAAGADKRAQKKEAPKHLTPEEETHFNVHKLPPFLRAVLLPFQLEGVEYCVSRGGRALLADEMGLGKSM
jgi:hypothetical protein